MIKKLFEFVKELFTTYEHEVDFLRRMREQ
jgi:hypothetical protein